MDDFAVDVQDQIEHRSVCTRALGGADRLVEVRGFEADDAGVPVGVGVVELVTLPR